MRAIRIGRHHWCLGKEREMAAVMIGIIWAPETRCLSNAVSIFDMYVMNSGNIESDRGRERQSRGNRQGRVSSLWHCLCVWRRGLCAVRSATPLWQCQRGVGGGGGGGWVWRQQAMLTGCHTCFQQHYLIVLTQLHEAIDALGELHHILNGLCYFDSTQLPHDFPGLRTDRTDNGFICFKTMYLMIATAAEGSTGPGCGQATLFW